MHQKQSNSSRSERFQQAALRADRAVVSWLKSAGLPPAVVLPGIALWRLTAAALAIVAVVACGLGVLVLRILSAIPRESEPPFRADDHQTSVFYHPREHNDAVDPRFDESSQRW